ncbi:MAG: sulfite exporter TauE/SafE family protein [Chromatiales bacterium]|nr:sulfite exporter TauE/SafE family protein [Chromatiales bacterium]
MPETSLIGAFLVGLLGGVHCAGMCGGIVGALTLGLNPASRAKPGLLTPYQLAYNGGRVFSYTLAGALAGGLGSLATGLGQLTQAQLLLQVVAGVFMISLGLYLGGWWSGLTKIERLGGRLWQHLEPMGRRFLPVRTPAQAFRLGLVWGWLPCGLVYSVLVWSLSAGDSLRGGLLMLFFGLGTLPTLLAMGFAVGGLSGWLRKPVVRKAAGLLVIGFGLLTITRALGWSAA